MEAIQLCFLIFYMETNYKDQKTLLPLLPWASGMYLCLQSPRRIYTTQQGPQFPAGRRNMGELCTYCINCKNIQYISVTVFQRVRNQIRMSMILGDNGHLLYIEIQLTPVISNRPADRTFYAYNVDMLIMGILITRVICRQYLVNSTFSLR